MNSGNKCGPWFVLAILLIALAGCSGKDGGQPRENRAKAEPPVPVVEDRVTLKTIPEQIRAIGNIEAYSTVSVKSRVDGEITGVHFKEGEAVHIGQPIFTIDPRPFQVQVEQAQANLARDAALLENARKQERRYRDLLDKHFVSNEMYAQIQTNAASAAAVVHADEAALKNARLQLSYCSITSPIDGVTGYLRVQAGNLVKANDTGPLVVINQITPIYVTFSVPEQYLPRIQSLMAGGAPVLVEAAPSGVVRPPEQGKLTFVDNAVDATTGTIKLRGTFGNKEHALWPGEFADVTMTLAQQQNAVVVPSQAVQAGPAGSFVYVIRGDMTVEQRRVVVDRALAGETVIRSGLDAGERIVTDGQSRLVPGAKVILKSVP